LGEPDRLHAPAVDLEALGDRRFPIGAEDLAAGLRDLPPDGLAQTVVPAGEPVAAAQDPAEEPRHRQRRRGPVEVPEEALRDGERPRERVALHRLEGVRLFHAPLRRAGGGRCELDRLRDRAALAEAGRGEGRHRLQEG